MYYLTIYMYLYRVVFDLINRKTLNQVSSVLTISCGSCMILNQEHDNLQFTILKFMRVGFWFFRRMAWVDPPVYVLAYIHGIPI